MKESELAKEVIKYFENRDNLICYKEVSKKGKGGAARNDCYFVKRDIDGNIIKTIAVETKMSLSMKVVQQAFIWQKMAHMSYVCVPKGKRKDQKDRKFLYDICKNYLKIGVIEVDTNTLVVTEIISSEYNHKPNIPPLFEEQKDSEAGNDKGQFFTAFKNTINLLYKYMEDKDQANWNDLIKTIPHHYKTNNSASAALRKFIGGKLIPDFKLIQEGKNLILTKKGV